MLRSAHVPVLLLVLLSACGGKPTAGGGDGGSGAVLSVTPPAATLVSTDGTPATQDYVATYTDANGKKSDVTAKTSFYVDDTSLGSFTGATLTATGTATGQTTVHAVYQGARATATATFQVVRHDLGQGVDPKVPGLFDAATDDPSRAPQIVYPSDGTLVPPNLGVFEVHWVESGASDVFEVRLTAANVDVRQYVQGDPSGKTWVAFAPDAWALVGAAAKGGTITVSVRGLTAADPSTSGKATISVGVSETNVEGGIYYWAAASSNGSPEGIYRHDFGKPAQTAQMFYTRQQTGDRCVACHVVSPDGTRMSVTFDGGDGPSTMLDVATRTPLIDTQGAFKWNFSAFVPDGKRIFTVRHGAMVLRDTDTGAVVTNVDTGGYATHPAVSPAGDEIAYVRPANASSDWAFTGGQIVVQSFDAAQTTFGTPTVLYTPRSGENAYYPSFSPDGQWLLFNVSSENAYDNASARLYVMRVDGTLAPTRLDQPDVAGGLTNSWPRWAPFPQTTRDADGNEVSFYWFTFSSKRAFGVRSSGGRPQIWMAPFFPDRIAVGDPPSAPAFRLPYQDLQTSNHIAQWTKKVVVFQ